jgi:hypothetical protein
MKLLAVIIYNLVILIGTVFLIVEYDWNAWWMLLAVFLLMGYKRVTNND